MDDRTSALLGLVEVDSGTLLVGDPSFALPWREQGKPGVDFDVVLKADASQFVAPLAGGPVLLLRRFAGEGRFPVYGEFENGDLVAVLIDLNPEVVEEDVEAED